MNFYYVERGEVKARAADQVPDSFNHPDRGSVSGMSTLEPGDLAELGWFAGTPTLEPKHDPASEKCYIAPIAPAGVDEFLQAWRDYKTARELVQRELDDGKIQDPALAPWPALPTPPTVLEHWIVEPLSAEELAGIRAVALRETRWRRDQLLAGTDRFMLLDSPLAGDALEKMKAYRQALRDLPDSVEDPREISWPVAPG